MQSNRCTYFHHYMFSNFYTQFCQVRQISEQDHAHCCDANNLISQRGACPPTLWSFHTLSVIFSTPFQPPGNACGFFLSLEVAILFTKHNSSFQSLRRFAVQIFIRRSIRFNIKLPAFTMNVLRPVSSISGFFPFPSRCFNSESLSIKSKVVYIRIWVLPITSPEIYPDQA